MEKTITITVKEYKSLLKDSEKLNFLEIGGVDNWAWYGESLNPEGYESYEETCNRIDKKYSE